MRWLTRVTWREAMYRDSLFSVSAYMVGLANGVIGSAEAPTGQGLDFRRQGWNRYGKRSAFRSIREYGLMNCTVILRVISER